jgi:hypothetical protein
MKKLVAVLVLAACGGNKGRVCSHDLCEAKAEQTECVDGEQLRQPGGEGKLPDELRELTARPNPS